MKLVENIKMKAKWESDEDNVGLWMSIFALYGVDFLSEKYYQIFNKKLASEKTVELYSH